MAVKQTPSAESFVIRVPAEGKSSAYRELADLGKVEDLGGTDALVLRTTKKSGNAKSEWRRVRDAAASAVTIQPVLTDEQHNQHYPTGEISIRFKEALSDEELKRFAARHKLRVRARNEFIPQQVVFELITPAETYLPDVIQNLSQAKETKQVWANTLSQYKRI